MADVSLSILPPGLDTLTRDICVFYALFKTGYITSRNWISGIFISIFGLVCERGWFFSVLWKSTR